jgi:hypothetical protein
MCKDAAIQMAMISRQVSSRDLTVGALPEAVSSRGSRQESVRWISR